ncbi:MAG: MarC family protein [Acidimicrobiia bacterium]|nr:MarC family protein [Acidimicrobiia bacterium]
MFEFAVASFLSFLVIVDPVGLAPLFLGITANRSDDDRRRIARNAVLLAALIIILFGLGGRPLLDYLGVSIDALRIAGGVLLFKLAFDMILAHRERATEAERTEAETADDVTVFPLAIPLLAGPGAFATVLVFVARADGRVDYLAVLFATVVLVFFISWLALRLASGVMNVLGATGVNVITRVFGIILAALAVQLVADGALSLWRS